MKQFRNLIEKRPFVPPWNWPDIFDWRQRTVIMLVAVVLFAAPGCGVTKRLDMMNAKMGQVAGHLEILSETNQQLAQLNETTQSMERRLETLEKLSTQLAKRFGVALASQEKKSSSQIVIQPPVQNPNGGLNAVPKSDDDAHNARPAVPWSAGSGRGGTEPQCREAL